MTTNPRVGFQGEHGAFSEEAALRLLGQGIQLVPCRDFKVLFSAIGTGAADLIVAPIENTIAGPIAAVRDLLASSGLCVVEDLLLPISLHLLGTPGARLEEIQRAQSHPVALAQCERFFRRHPAILPVAADDTAGSVRAIMEAGDPACAAIAGNHAAKIYGASVLLEHIEDRRKNYTRFVFLARSLEAFRALAILSSTPA